jgi:hypothetical protein
MGMLDILKGTAMTSRPSHWQRGQVFPIWIGSIFLTLVFAFVLVNYANVLTVQIKAQNAADSAAAAVVSIQSQEWNQIDEILYGAAVEEYRLRHLLEGIRLSAQLSGGCNTIGRSCATVYQNMYKAYFQSVYRYDADVQLLSQASTTMGFQNIYKDGYALLQRLSSSCGSAPTTSLDCGLTYALTGYTARSVVGESSMYPAAILLQGPSANPTSAWPAFFAPITVEVSVCSRVDPIFKGFWLLGAFPSVPVVARGAATDAMVVQEWIQPGLDTNPATGKLYQPTEVYGDPAPDGTNWYTVNYGGNTASANPFFPVYTASINNDEFSQHIGWWGPIPVYPFTGPKSTQQLFGSSAGACT